MSKQLSEMNSKLDRLINAIEKMSGPKVASPVVLASKPALKVAPVVAKKIEVKKVVAKASAKKVVVKKAVGKKKK